MESSLEVDSVDSGSKVKSTGSGRKIKTLASTVEIKNIDVFSDEGCTPKEKPWNFDVAGQPMVAIHSVSIHLNDSVDHDDYLELYGEIMVKDGQGTTFPIYDRKEAKPEFLDIDDELILIDTEPIYAPLPMTTIKVFLMDRKQVDSAQGSLLIDDSLVLDFRDTDIPIQETKQGLIGDGSWYVVVRYSIYRVAVLAYLHLVPLKMKDVVNENPDAPFEMNWVDYNFHGSTDVHGDIVVYLHSSYDIVKDEVLVHFTTRDSKPVNVNYGSPLKIRRSLLAVPAYSFLQCKVSFDDTEYVSEALPTQHLGFTSKFFKASDYILGVDVLWTSKRLDNKMVFLAASRFSNEQLSCSLISSVPGKWKFTLKSMVEVFSVFLVRDKSENDVGKVYGSIEVEDDLDKYYIFLRDEQHPCTLQSGNLLLIEGPPKCSIQCTSWCMKLDLKDTEGRELCRGCLGWSDSNLTASWYDKQICSVVPGTFGWAEVHYAMFSKAVQATVKVLFSFHPCSDKTSTDVSGSLIAEYGNYNYSTVYECKRYRSVLFSKSQGEDSVSLSADQEIPLQLTKSIVVVPKCSTLIVVVDLLACSMVDSSSKVTTDRLCGTTEFHIGSECRWRIAGEDFYVDVLVDWSSIFSACTKSFESKASPSC